MNVADRLAELTGGNFIIDALLLSFDGQCARSNAVGMRDFNAGNVWGRTVEQLENGEMLKRLVAMEQKAIDGGLIEPR